MGNAEAGLLFGGKRQLGRWFDWSGGWMLARNESGLGDFGVRRGYSAWAQQVAEQLWGFEGQEPAGAKAQHRF